MVDIEPCPCGAKARLGGIHRPHVVCTAPRCWTGPCADTPEAAIAAWNRVAGQRWRPIETAPEDRRGLIIHVEPGVGATHWRPALEPPEGDEA